MMRLELAKKAEDTLRILCIGAHSDDIEIGCGGTIIRLLSEHDDVKVHWVVLGSSGRRNGEAEESARRFLSEARSKTIEIMNFKDSFFPYIGADIKNYFEELGRIVSPDMVFTHYRYDLHQDHRMVSELTWNTFRDHLILEYEVVKYDGDLSSPNCYFHLTEETCRQKIDIIMESFDTQRAKDWFERETFISMLRIRGVESRAPEKYAEGFYCRKAVF